MIFVTVGTHEQPFDRLLREVDRLREYGAFDDDVFIQSGYSRYQPKFCRFEPFIGFDEMNRLMTKARIIITHGGTGSVMLALRHGKLPVIAPRRKQHGEHIDDHQVHFCNMMESRGKGIVVYDMNQLKEALNSDALKRASLIQPSSGATGERFGENAVRVAQKLDEICSGWFPEKQP